MYTKSTSSSAIKPFFPVINQINQLIPSRTTDDLEKMQNMLNSQRIEFLFKNYGIELMSQEGNVRISNLNSNGTMRTCAIVHFSLPVPTWLQDTHDKIYGGGSIGQTIKEDGFNLSKENVYFGMTELPKIVKDKMETNENSAAVHIYQLVVKNPSTTKSFIYCNIAEVHSPLYLTLGDLNLLSNEEIQKYSAVTDSVQKCLDTFGVIDALLHIPEKMI